MGSSSCCEGWTIKGRLALPFSFFTSASLKYTLLLEEPFGDCCYERITHIPWEGVENPLGSECIAFSNTPSFEIPK